MLGIRLDVMTEAALQRMARRSGRTKSDVAREAIRTYVNRDNDDAELQRELAAIASLTRDADLARLDEVNDDLLDLIEEEERASAGRRAA